MISRMQEILSGKDLDREQRMALITAKEHSELVIDPKALDPLIHSYEDSNKTLKLENSVLRNDTTRLSDALETLIRDNSKLRGFIQKKNGDLGKLMTSIAQEEGEYIKGLKENIGIVEEENKFLLFKVEQLEELLRQQEEESAAKGAEILGGKKVNRRIVEDLHEFELKEKGFIEKIRLLELRLGKMEGD
jgi:regulator of replication initiation timing